MQAKQINKTSIMVDLSDSPTLQQWNSKNLNPTLKNSMLKCGTKINANPAKDVFETEDVSYLCQKKSCQKLQKNKEQWEYPTRNKIHLEKILLGYSENSCSFSAAVVTCCTPSALLLTLTWEVNMETTHRSWPTKFKVSNHQSTQCGTQEWAVENTVRINESTLISYILLCAC